MQKAQQAVDAAFERRQRRVEQANRKITRYFKASVGDYVWIAKAPVPGRAAKLDDKFSGPWQLMSMNGDSGLSFTCRMQGRKVRRCSAHVEHMKPYHSRPRHLDPNTVPAPLTAEEVALMPHCDKLLCIHDRRAGANDSWEYKWQARDGSVSHWVTEDEMLDDTGGPAVDARHLPRALRATPCR